MFELLFMVLMLVVVGKMIGLAFKMTWGITKVLFNIILLPITLICMVIGGLIHLALPILIVVGIIALLTPGKKA